MKSKMIPNKAKPFLYLAAALAAIIPLSSCQSLGKSATKAPVYVERPVEALYNEARDLVQKRQFAEAITAFEEVDRQHPYSEWARRSILMAGYSNYRLNKYEDAIANAQRFIEIFQSNQDNSAYAYYLIATCYFEQIVDVGRDQRMTELALAALNQVVQRYPDTAYARDARLKMDMTRDQLAGKEMAIGRFYMNEGQQLASIGRFRRVVDLYQTTSHVPEALHRLVEAYLTLGMFEEAKQVGAVLGYNYPGSEWYEVSYSLLTDKGLKPAKPPRKILKARVKSENRSFFRRKARDVSPASTQGTALPPNGV